MTDITQNPAVVEVTKGVTTLEKLAENYAITTAEQYTAGAADLQRVKGMQKKLEETRTSITKPMNEALDRVNAFFRKPADTLKAIELKIKGALRVFSDEQEARAREEQRKADERAAAERKRAEEAAAAERRKAEEAAAELRRKAEAEAAAGNAAEAAKLQQRADTKLEKAETKAATLESQAQTVVAPIIRRDPPKVTGINYREAWKFEVTDVSLVPREYLMVDETKIRKIVQAMKGDTKIAGVRVYSEKQIASGAA